MREKGLKYENIAKKHLEKFNYRLVEQNYLCKMGEIDLIMQNGDTLAFVEVRYREKEHYGSPEESITPAKIRKIIKTAQLYLTTTNSWDYNCRFDVVAITGKTSLLSKPKINWIQGAFEYQEH